LPGSLHPGNWFEFQLADNITNLITHIGLYLGKKIELEDKIILILAVLHLPLTWLVTFMSL